MCLQQAELWRGWGGVLEWGREDGWDPRGRHYQPGGAADSGTLAAAR